MVRALQVSPGDSTASIVDVADSELGEGDVDVDVEYSSVNYKDGMALLGRPGVLREPNRIPGIDLVGTVTSSGSTHWSAGDRVILTGWGVGEQHPGGLAERAHARAEWLVRLPDSLTPARAAAIGTAGFTAMLAVLALERHGIVPDAAAPVLVTGASGGVGSIAIALLASLGHTVVASTGRAEEADYLRALGATEVIDRATLGERGKPLQSQRWGAAVDSVGSQTLATVLSQVRYGGIVASCGLAQGADLPATVLPFILRSVTLAGINSVECPAPLRQTAWDRLAADLDLDLLDSMTATVGLADAVGVAERILDGQVRGRTVVDVRA